MDIGKETVLLMSRYDVSRVQKPSDQPPKDFTSHAKCIRKTTRDILRHKGGHSQNVILAFEEYASAVVNEAALACESSLLQSTYEGMSEGDGNCEEGMSAAQLKEATTHLLGAPLSPAAAVKKGLGIKTKRKEVILPLARKNKGNK